MYNIVTCNINAEFMFGKFFCSGYFSTRLAIVFYRFYYNDTRLNWFNSLISITPPRNLIYRFEFSIYSYLRKLIYYTRFLSHYSDHVIFFFGEFSFVSINTYGINFRSKCNRFFEFQNCNIIISVS